MKLPKIRENLPKVREKVSDFMSPKLNTIKIGIKHHGITIKNFIFRFISTKVDVSKIILDHYNTLYNYKNGSNVKDLFTFIGIPIIISWVLVFRFGGTVNDGINESLMLSLSIFTPIMFSLLVGIYTVDRKRLTKKKTHKIIKEFKSNVSFLVIISILSIFFLVINSMKLWDNPDYVSVLSFIILSLLGIISLTILQVLKRWNYLLDETLDEIEPREEKIL